MVDSPIIVFKAPDKDQIADITKIDDDDDAATSQQGSAAPTPENK
jgi:hypothetical protein